MKNAVFWMLCRVAIVRTDILEECNCLDPQVEKNQRARNISTNQKLKHTAKKEAICSSKMSVLTRATWRYITEDDILQRCTYFNLPHPNCNTQNEESLQ
jgi:hypothetical protein